MSVNTPAPSLDTLTPEPKIAPDNTLLLPVLLTVSVRPEAKLMLYALLISAPRSRTSPVVALLVVNAALSVMLPPYKRMGPLTVRGDATVKLAVLVDLPKVKLVAALSTVNVEGNDTALVKVAPNGSTYTKPVVATATGEEKSSLSPSR